MQDVFLKRPFKTRNADEYDLTDVLNLFVNPIQGLTSPFEFENSIVKGRMGSGKTMYLRANYAYYLYRLVPSIINSERLIIPVMIRLSDFQHISDPVEIYKSIILKIIEELSSVYLHLQNAEKLAQIHLGIKSIPNRFFGDDKLAMQLTSLTKLESEEYVQRVTEEFGLKGGIKPKFFSVSSEFNKTVFLEIKKKPSLGIGDVESSYKHLFKDCDAQLLLLIDEAGALDRGFFKESAATSLFEILMNQLRTADYIRTKIAVYPHSYSDILTETRYGDNIDLEEDINSPEGYDDFRNRLYGIIQNYLFNANEQCVSPGLIFDLSETSSYGDCLEQIINGGNGNLRRTIQLLDSAMDVAYRSGKGQSKVTKAHTFDALSNHSSAIEKLYNPLELEFLDSLITVCKARSTYRFQFPHMSPALYKYTNRSQEYNLLNILELGVGRKGTTYAFDYSFCIAHDIPTHYQGASEKIEKERTLDGGYWIRRTAQITEELIQHAYMPGKIEGEISFIKSDAGFVTGDNGIDYFFTRQYVIEDDIRKTFIRGGRLRFFPSKEGDAEIAYLIEIL